MASSRIFVRGLPPSITEADFRKHFSAKDREITDIKLLPKRRIGYVGYRTPEDANGAVKYFNRTFIRMSRVEVELAKSISDPSLRPQRHRTGGDARAQQPEKPPQPEQSEAADKTRKRKRDVDEADPKLREYLQVMQRSVLPSTADGIVGEDIPAAVPEPDDGSGDEYEELPASKKNKKDQTDTEPTPAPIEPSPPSNAGPTSDQGDSHKLEATEPPPSVPAPQAPHIAADMDDDEWLRSRTNRVLDLVDADDLDANSMRPPPTAPQRPSTSTGGDEPGEEPETANGGLQENKTAAPAETMDVDAKNGSAEEMGETQSPSPSPRLFVRNLPYSATEDELRKHFAGFGSIEEAHIAVGKDGSPKGFGFVLFAEAAAAEEARKALDGSPFLGRLIHILPAEAKREQGLDEFALSKLPLKKQNLIRKKAEAASKTFNWNSLYMSQDAVNTSVADRLGISKSDMLDPTSSDAAVKQALAETNIIQETKAYFAANGVDFDAFKSQKRGDKTILVKNFPHGTSMDELRTLFEAHGTVLKVLMPPSGTIAIVSFAQPVQAKAAFAALAYSRIKESVLFLEKGPTGLFGKESVSAKATNNDNNDAETPGVADRAAGGVQKLSVNELLERSDDNEEPETCSLFVRNLAFATTTPGLEQAFRSLDGFVSARVKTKTDAKRPGQVLSMGFGFVEFRTKEDAQAALKVMDGFVLDGHTLGVKSSHKGHDAAEERRREDKAKKAAGKRTKIIIKNLPFEATKKDVRTLFGTYGQLRSVRVPKKFDKSRGFGFAEFVTPREAENALNALKDTHLLGRRLVLDYAEADAVDAEEEIAKMQRKIGGQVNKVALQQLTGRGRTKVNIDNGVDNQGDEY